MAVVSIGVISDTHGLIRPQALDALRGCAQIVHAGDVGSAAVLTALREIAPVVAVRGNVDREVWAYGLPKTAVVEVGAARLYVLHDLYALDLDLKASGFAAAISGHSHRAAVSRRDGLLYLNPGSAGPARLGLSVSVARLRVGGSCLEAEVVELAV